MSDQPDWDKQSQQDKATRVLDFLNRLTGQKFKATNPNGQPTSNCKIIVDRIKEGYGKDDFINVVRTQHREWSGDDKMAKYLRPSTLFRKSNFEQYLATIDNRAPDGAVKGDSDKEPDVYQTVEDFLADYQRRGGSWGYEMPEAPIKAASWWINEMQEPCGRYEKAYQQESKHKKNKKVWITPHIDRVMTTLKKFLGLSREDQIIIVGCVAEGVPWRGDDMEIYYHSKHSIYNETLNMREIGVEEYKQELKPEVRRILNGITEESRA